MDEQIKDMLMSFCSIEDICAALRIQKEELDTVCWQSFAMGLDEAERVFSAQGRAALHKAQVAAAMDGNNSMLILLGKQYLGQSDDAPQKREAEQETELGNVLKLYEGAKDRKQRAAR